MDEREQQLEILRRHASNTPSSPPAPSRAPGLAHQYVKAVVQGIGPVIREQFDSLRRENAELRSQNEVMRAEHRAELATLRARSAEIDAGLAETRRELEDIRDGADPGRRYL